MNIRFNENILNIGEKELVLDHAILDVLETEDGILVVYDYMEYPKNLPANNLVKIDVGGKELWKAENPTNFQTDAYTNFCRTRKYSKGTVAVNNFAGYYCEISLSDGKLINAEFTK